MSVDNQGQGLFIENNKAPAFTRMDVQKSTHDDTAANDGLQSTGTQKHLSQINYILGK